MKLRLHNYWRSSASHRVRIGLALKGVAYEYVAVNILQNEQTSDSYRAMNAMQQVPTLEVVEDDGSRWHIAQSIAILEYLDERWPDPPILPRDRYLRARTRALAEVVNSGIQPHQNLPVLRAVGKLGGDAQAWPKPFIANGLAAYEELLVDTYRALGTSSDVRFSAGDVPTIADCCLIPQLAAARRFGVDYAQHTHIVRIEKNCLALPAFQHAAPEAQPDAVKS